MTDFFDTDDVLRRTLERDLKHIVQFASDNASRSQQKEIGPSEIGNDCARAIAYKLMGEPPVAGSDGDCLASVIGTAAHAWMENAIAIQNRALGRVRWISEQKVVWRQNYRPGTCDCFDIDTQTVIDFKFPGPTRFKHYVKNGPSSLYRRQVHTYGKGYEDTFGVPVKNVAIFFLGRASTLSNAHLWMEPYDRSVAVTAVNRIDEITLVCADLDVENHPDRYSLIPACPSEECRFCDYFNPNPQGPLECSGAEGLTKPAADEPTAAIEQLRLDMEANKDD